MKKTLVTGGCGFVGRHLIAKLAKERENEIWAVDNLSIGRHPNKGLKKIKGRY